MSNIAETVKGLIKETVEAQGVTLWDVRFLKEGADWFLRVFIDKPSGVSIDDCVNVSHAIDPIIDQADPIDCSYCLEVCSPGIERELTEKAHFEANIGKKVKVKLYKAVNGKKEILGTLLAFDGGIKLLCEEEIYLEKSEIASVRLADDTIE